MMTSRIGKNNPEPFACHPEAHPPPCHPEGAIFAPEGSQNLDPSACGLQDDKRSQRGFTLLELLLCITILTGSLVYILGALANTGRFLTHSRLRIEAMSQASGKLIEWAEALRQSTQADVTLSGGSFENSTDLDWKADTQEMTGKDLPENDFYGVKLNVFRRSGKKQILSLSTQGWKKPVHALTLQSL